MGQTLRPLAFRKLTKEAVFNNRFVVECCETMHTHYRNLRISQSKEDWVNFAKGMKDAYERWLRLGSPEPKKGVHIELCRKEVATQDSEPSIKVNLNHNLYTKIDGIFSQGSKIQDDTYIHLKIRDLRLELSLEEFTLLAEAVEEAKQDLEVKQ